MVTNATPRSLKLERISYLHSTSYIAEKIKIKKVIEKNDWILDWQIIPNKHLLKPLYFPFTICVQHVWAILHDDGSEVQLHA